jgi:hypothetical protein
MHLLSVFCSSCTDISYYRHAVDEHKETTERKGSIFDDEQKRRENLARLTANMEGE